MNDSIDQIELKKIAINKQLYSINRADHFEIDTVLDILNVETLPLDIPLNNNQIFIRDLTSYLVSKGLEPNINKQ